jgi:acyl carrier protein
MTTQEQIRIKVRAILAMVAPGIDSGLGDEDDIFTAGIDSVTTMMLITEIEQQFSISLDGDDIPYENFRTIDGISTYIEKSISLDNSR